jgi:hopanoid biosynthesis associated RND transporter like protein HpnN
MLTVAVVRIIEFCTRHAWPVIAAGIALALISGTYAARHFAINSDVGALLSPNLEWRKREIAFEQTFNRFDLIVAVVTAPTPELTGEATKKLAEKLAQNKERFRTVTQVAGGQFFERNGLLYQSPEELKRNLDGLNKAEPLIADLAVDQSLRGLTSGIDNALLAVRSKYLTLDDMAPSFNTVSDTLEKIIAGQPASFSWRLLAERKTATPSELRGFIEVRPVLDYAALEPGHGAIKAIRDAGAEILPQYQANVRLTGPVPMADEEFATLKENAELNALVTIAIVLCILWLALRSKRLILAVFVNLFVGLSLTAALGLLMVGAFNLISVSFAVLFVGIGVDFGIQYAVRYRHERHENDDLMGALRAAGGYVGAPLTLAAGATAAGFMSFMPTAYRGISELGLIAGCGMMIAFATTITLLPALIRVFNPPGEPEALGYKALAPVDAFMERNRIPIIVCTAVAVLGAMPLLYWLRFDFNPVNLRSPKVESVATYLELNRDPESNTNTVGVLKPSLKEADESAARLAKLPEVSRVVTLSKFVPEQQDQKLPLIRNSQKALAEALNPKDPMGAPTDEENVEAFTDSAMQLNKFAGNLTTVGADAARRMARALETIAKGDKALRDRTEAVFLPPLKVALNSLSSSLQAQPVTRQSLPAELTREWIAQDARARVAVAPSGNPNDNEQMRHFARTVLAIEPTAIEGPISVLEAGDTVVRAFIEAGFWALLSIGVLLWIVLRRIGDVLLTLVPLVLAAVVTLQISVAVGMPMNFANIIALPLLLGVGVAFKIYYIMAWRDGQTNLLQTSLTRAVFYSALTTATAFGSLWFSSHPGTSSMGELLALSLICTLAAAVLFQPVLMGRPREMVAEDGPAGVEPPPRPVEFAPAVQSAAASIRQAPAAAALRTNGNGASSISGKPDNRVAAEPKAAVPPRQRGNGSSETVSHENGAAMALDSAEPKDDALNKTGGAARRKKPPQARRTKAVPTRKQ